MTSWWLQKGFLDPPRDCYLYLGGSEKLLRCFVRRSEIYAYEGVQWANGLEGVNDHGQEVGWDFLQSNELEKLLRPRFVVPDVRSSVLLYGRQVVRDWWILSS